MGAHSVKDGGRTAKLAGRGLLSAAAALALLGGGAGMALAGEASHGTSHDSDHRDHDKSDEHEKKGKHHKKDRDKDRDKDGDKDGDKDRDEDGPTCEVEEGPLTPVPGLGPVLDPPTTVCGNDVPIQDETDPDMTDPEDEVTDPPVVVD